MPSDGRTARDVLKAVVAGSAVYTAAAGLLFYALGYLSVRFQLAALGLASDLQLIDERYLFEGAKVAVYFLCAAPIAALAVLPPLLLFIVLARRKVPAEKLPRGPRDGNTALLSAALLAAVVMVQLVMRKCFRFENLLLREELPGPAWLAGMLQSNDDMAVQLYLAALLLATVLCAAPLLLVRSWESATPTQRVLAGVLGIFVTVQAVLLPIHHGIFIGTRWFARLAAPPPEAHGAAAWLVWEGQDRITFLAAHPDGRRTLVAVPRKDVGALVVTGYDLLPTVRAWTDPPVAPESRAHTEAARPEPATEPAREPPAATRTAATSTAPVTPPQPDAEPAPEPLLRQAFHLLGMDATPGRQRTGPALSEPVRGDLVIIAVEGGAQRQLTQDGGYRSPTFTSDGKSLLAIRDARFVKIHIESARRTDLAPAPSVRKLLACEPGPASLCYALVDHAGKAACAKIDPTTGELIAVAPLAASDDDLTAWLAGEDRGESIRVLLRQERSAILPPWTELWVQSDGQPPRQLTFGNGRSSRQPVLSPDERSVAFIRTGG